MMLFMRLPFAWVKRSNRLRKAIHSTPIFLVPFSDRKLRTPAHIKSDISKSSEGTDHDCWDSQSRWEGGLSDGARTVVIGEETKTAKNPPVFRGAFLHGNTQPGSKDCFTSSPAGLVWMTRKRALFPIRRTLVIL